MAIFKIDKSWVLLTCVCLLLLVIFTPFIANDKPIIVRYAGDFYFPIIKNHPETTFGGIFETDADFTDPVVMTLVQADGWVLMPPIPYAPNTPTAAIAHPSTPSAQHLLGTDGLGRDMMAVVLYGLRVSLLFALGLSVTGAFIGIGAGVIMGYLGGWTDILGQRLIEILLGLPQLFILMIVASVFAPSIWVLFGVMLMMAWLPFVALARVHSLQLKNSAYILSAKNMGVATSVIYVRHLLPSILRLILAQMPFIVATNITALTALDFLGFELPIGWSSLGELLAQAKNHLDTPHIAIVAIGALSCVLIMLILLGEYTRTRLTARGEYHA